MQVKKSPKADLEKKKMIFLEIGLVLALAICFVAFEWTTKDIGQSSLGDLQMDADMEEEIENTFMEEEPPPPPAPPPPPEPETVIEELTVVEDDIKVDDINIDSEANEDTQTATTIIESFEPVEEEVEPISFAVVEDKPEFPGGEAELIKYVAANTKYPEIAKENGIQGRVFVQFVIDKVGKVTKVKIAKSVDPYLDAEALRVMKTLPNWKPGKQRGKAVPVTFIMPVSFKLF